jgi:hypothetical protein
VDRVVDVALEEYRALGRDAEACVGRQQQILQLGIAALGVTIGLGIQLSRHPRTSAAVLAGVVPVIAAASLLLWMGETENRLNIGIQQIVNETLINGIAGTTILSWQRRRATVNLARPRSASRSLVVALVYSALGGLGSVSGLYSVRHFTVALVVLAGLDAVLLGGVAAAYVRAQRRVNTALDEVRAHAQDA